MLLGVIPQGGAVQGIATIPEIVWEAFLGLKDGPNLVTLAMNGWADAEPAWWLNLKALPDTTVELKDGLRAVRGRAAEGEERDRLWARWGEFSEHYDAWAAMRSGQTAVVLLEPRVAAADTA